METMRHWDSIQNDNQVVMMVTFLFIHPELKSCHNLFEWLCIGKWNSYYSLRVKLIFPLRQLCSWNIISKYLSIRNKLLHAQAEWIIYFYRVVRHKHFLSCKLCPYKNGLEKIRLKFYTIFVKYHKFVPVYQQQIFACSSWVNDPFETVLFCQIHN